LDSGSNWNPASNSLVEIDLVVDDGGSTFLGASFPLEADLFSKSVLSNVDNVDGSVRHSIYVSASPNIRNKRISFDVCREDPYDDLLAPLDVERI
jgi:hypothetical protein